MFHQTLLDQPMLTSLDSVNQMTLNISKWNMIDLSNQCWKSSSVIKSDCTVLYLYMKLKIKSRNFISRFEMLMAEIMFTYTCTCICLHSTDPVYIYTYWVILCGHDVLWVGGEVIHQPLIFLQRWRIHSPQDAGQTPHCVMSLHTKQVRYVGLL